MSPRESLLVWVIVLAGSMAGLFYGWTVSVIPGTRKIDDAAYVSTMQSINREIINPWFVVPFMTVPLFLIASVVVEFRAGNTRRSWVLGAAALTYLVGVLGVTIGGNVPLNNSLDAVGLTSLTDSELSRARLDYETPWNRWHNLRAAAAVLTFAIATVAATVAEAEG